MIFAPIFGRIVLQPSNTEKQMAKKNLQADNGVYPRGFAYSPKMHNGGEIKVDGDYELKAGEKVVPQGRQHQMNQKAVSLEKSATGPNADDVAVKGPQPVWRATSNALNTPAKAIEIKRKELRDGSSDWKELQCPSSMCNCSSCQDDRRK